MFIIAPHENNATLSKTAMTRNGKIARLPLAIRQQLNLRLQNGELARDLPSWLNQLPEVEAKRNSSAFATSLASVPSTAPTPPRKACFHRNPNLIELN
ncbi:MAG: hypothetical protein ACLQVY_28665 [Limisphaerales bacterium]